MKGELGHSRFLTPCVRARHGWLGRRRSRLNLVGSICGSYRRDPVIER